MKREYEFVIADSGRRQILPVTMPAAGMCDNVALDLGRVLAAEYCNEVSDDSQERLSREHFVAEPFEEGRAQITRDGVLVASLQRLSRERKAKENK
jgi:hypothetical protein